MTHELRLPYTDIVLRKGTLVFLGSRPGMGKTSYLLQLIRQNSTPTNSSRRCMAYFPFQRTETIESMLLSRDLLNGNLITDHSCICSTHELRERIISDVQQHHAAYIIIDGLERIAIPSHDDHRFDELVKELYCLSEELDIPFICTAYLNSGLEERFGAKYPQLSDFTSAAMELYADLILGLHRPYYFGFEEDEDGNNVRNKASLFVIQDKNGKSRRYDFLYNEERHLFLQ